MNIAAEKSVTKKRRSNNCFVRSNDMLSQGSYEKDYADCGVISKKSIWPNEMELFESFPSLKITEYIHLNACCPFNTEYYVRLVPVMCDEGRMAFPQ